MVYNYIMTKPEKLFLFLFVVHCFCLFGGFIFIWYLKIKIRNLMEQNSLLLQCFCKENININISKEK